MKEQAMHFPRADDGPVRTVKDKPRYDTELGRWVCDRIVIHLGPRKALK